MLKNLKNVFKFDKSKLTREELEINLKIIHISMVICIISLILLLICIIFSSKGFTLGYFVVVMAIIFCTSLTVIYMGGDPYRDIQKLENIKNGELKAKNIVTLIKEGKLNEIYCKDKDINKLLLDINLEEGKIGISIKEDNIVVTTSNGMEIPFKIENVNDYFGIY